ncbi:hypothetical protein [Rathayibacter tanaceti]|uniref:Uncharacterized protein n=2 Tax=Rathayibacter tanaceti TaxID=1671680 RepID=A0A162FV33_9MICO|nr:hypothetical protein [Rathayibacter tanaceti]KZX19920.1 hypothetical protein ACH61_02979 [Rathayibacter tanaceti]QHC55005.1 hypothetical protein GSU10_04690 [Rathayibacter tanaceti]TCO38558.1 hypothetical protein EV639_102203 [Rathayibacter tanaceti]
MRSLLALASVLHASPAPVLAALADLLVQEDARFELRGSGLERRLPVLGREQWRVIEDEEGSRVECELLASPASSALAGVLARRSIREAPERFRAVVTAVAAAVE